MAILLYMYGSMQYEQQVAMEGPLRCWCMRQCQQLSVHACFPDAIHGAPSVMNIQLGVEQNMTVMKISWDGCATGWTGAAPNAAQACS